MYQRYINPLSTLDPGIAERDVAPAPFRKTSFSGLVEEVLSTAPSRPLRSVRLTKEKAVPSATPSERCAHALMVVYEKNMRVWNMSDPS